jgi:hypothetical protein
MPSSPVVILMTTVSNILALNCLGFFGPEAYLQSLIMAKKWPTGMAGKAYSPTWVCRLVSPIEAYWRSFASSIALARLLS